MTLAAGWAAASWGGAAPTPTWRLLRCVGQSVGRAERTCKDGRVDARPVTSDVKSQSSGLKRQGPDLENEKTWLQNASAASLFSSGILRVWRRAAHNQAPSPASLMRTARSRDSTHRASTPHTHAHTHTHTHTHTLSLRVQAIPLQARRSHTRAHRKQSRPQRNALCSRRPAPQPTREKTPRGGSNRDRKAEAAQGVQEGRQNKRISRRQPWPAMRSRDAWWGRQHTICTSPSGVRCTPVRTRSRRGHGARGDQERKR